ncbi:MAG TPA: hypothetical protein V6C72_17420, partial [Chroococcales cyanobacterium]
SNIGNHASAVTLPKQMPSLRAAWQPRPTPVLETVPVPAAEPDPEPERPPAPVFRTTPLRQRHSTKYVDGFVDLHSRNHFGQA